MNKSNPRKALVYALLTVVIWSTVATAFKLALARMSFAELLFWASLFSVFVLGAVLVSQKKTGLIRCLSVKDIVRSLGAGFLNPFLYYLILFKAYELLPAQEAQVLNYTWGVTLALMGVLFLKQKMNSMQLLAILISYAGVWVISTHGRVFSLDFSSPQGVMLALASTVIWSSYWLINAQDKLDSVLRLYLNFCFGTVYSGIWLWFGAGLNIPSWSGLAGAAYVGFFEMGISFVLWLTALKYASSAGQISHLIYLSPFCSLFLIYFFVGEQILPSTIAGLGLILAGLGVKFFGDKRKV